MKACSAVQHFATKHPATKYLATKHPATKHLAIKRLTALLCALAAWCLLLAPLGATPRAQEDTSFFTADSSDKFSVTCAFLPPALPPTLSPAETPPRQALTQVVVRFRIRYDALNFAKYDAPTAPSGAAFAAFPSVVIEFMDADGIIRASAVWRDTVLATYSKTISTRDYVVGQVALMLAPGTFILTAEMGDRTLPRLLRLREKGIVVPSIQSHSSLASPLFGKPLAVRSWMLSSWTTAERNSERGNERSNEIAFGERCDALFPFSSSNAFFHELSQESLQSDIQGRVRRMDAQPTNAELRCESVSLVRGAVQADKRGGVSILSAPDSAALHRASDGSSANTSSGNTSSGTATDGTIHQGCVVVRLPVERMDEGEYELSLVRPQSRDTLVSSLAPSFISLAVTRFRVAWANKPRSLVNLNYAVDVMKYILSDEEYTAMATGSTEQVRERFAAFWHKHDPTPQTAYNEALVAYFQRVDEAFFRFTNTQAGIPDGAKTERGKVYILCGAPSSIETTTLPNGFIAERWRYTNAVKKEFLFEVQPNGNALLKNVIE
jgi:GWxTD domain-containing protein